jgi:hypothetical protein
MMAIRKWLVNLTFSEKSIAPLVVFRVLFGIMMMLSTLRFISKGWVEDLYIQPAYFFTYLGFDWVKPFDAMGMYILFSVLIASCVFISLGFLYRISTVVFFICFTYIELIDKTNYLNHYYFISLVGFLLIFLPANKSFSLDTYFRFTSKKKYVPAWTIHIIMFQLAVVYVFAGIAKLNYHWLFEAQPLINWLKHQTDLPLIGPLMKFEFTAYLFSWGGALFDLSIPFLLLNPRFRIPGYLLVVLFHGLTAVMFPIGVFPYVMIISTLIFFPESFHEKIIRSLRILFRAKNENQISSATTIGLNKSNIHASLIALYVAFQILVPLRYLLYDGDLFWTEQGYRFSWRVMLIEKVGYAQFFIHDPTTDNKKLINNRTYLTPQQEKMMATQPDMILQFAHHLRDRYEDTIIIENNGQRIKISEPKITAEVYVSLFNKGSRLFIDSDVNLSKIHRGFHDKDWILKNEN